MKSDLLLPIDIKHLLGLGEASAGPLANSVVRVAFLSYHPLCTKQSLKHLTNATVCSSEVDGI